MRKIKWSGSKKILTISLVALLAAASVSGCAKPVDLTSEEQELVAEYAAQVVLKHDKNYDGKLEELTTKEETTSKKKSDDISTTSETEISSQPDTDTTLSFADSFGFSPLTVNYTGYEVLDSYPQATDMTFVLNSTQDTSLLVLKFAVSNETDSAVNVPMMSFDTSLKAVINNNNKYSALVTLLMDGLNTFQGTIEAGQTQNLVLVFQIPYHDNSAIENLELKISGSKGNATFDLK